MGGDRENPTDTNEEEYDTVQTETGDGVPTETDDNVPTESDWDDLTTEAEDDVEEEAGDGIDMEKGRKKKDKKKKKKDKKQKKRKKELKEAESERQIIPIPKKDVNDQLMLSICALFFCLPVGIAATVLSFRSKKYTIQKKRNLAKIEAKKARRVACAGTFIGAIVITAIVIVSVLYLRTLIKK